MSLAAYTSETNNLKLQECLQQMEFTVITTTIVQSNPVNTDTGTTGSVGIKGVSVLNGSC